MWYMDTVNRLTHRILGCAFEVHRELGPFLQESFYQRAMEIALTRKGIGWQAEYPVAILFKNETIGTGRLDLLVEEKVILELKAAQTLCPAFTSQVIQYLAATKLRLGLLLNFGGTPKLEYKRIIL